MTTTKNILLAKLTCRRLTGQGSAGRDVARLGKSTQCVGFLT